ncbi:MAG: hypothetical protein E4G91_01215 [Candidatus Zixiibacteriota bacterium]|nr:MAG: hypothetical protein E4G91_01215 [candidate division Zixibacteria bacterium]
MCNTEFAAIRSYHIVDQTTVAMILISGIVLFLNSACCLWILFGGAAFLIEFSGRRAVWFGSARRIVGDTQFTMQKTGWPLRRMLAPMLAVLLLLSCAASGSDQVLQKPLASAVPKSKRAAVIYSLLSTSIPMVVGGVMMHNDRSAPLGTGIASFGLILGPGTGHVYAGNTRRFWSGAATRCLVLSSSVAAILINDSSGDSWEEGLPKAMLAIGVIGAGVTICTVSAIRDIATADNSVDDYNSAHGFRSLTFRPIYITAYKTPGLLLRLTF